MAYGPLAQCAFMSGPPQFRKKLPMKYAEKVLWDAAPTFKPPDKCEAPAPGAFVLYAFEAEEAKADATKGHVPRSMPMDDLKHLVFGSSQEVDGQVYDGHKSVLGQHTCIYHVKGKWFLKAINGSTYVESMTLHPYLRDMDGKQPKRYTSANTRKVEMIEPMDPKRKLTREMCIFRCGDSDRRFWIQGTLPLGDGEFEELAAGERAERKEKRREKGRKEDRDDRSRTRSRSRKRRK